MHVRMAACIAAAILSFSCSASRPTSPTPVAPIAPAPSIHIAGTVVDYASGKPVPSVSISWQPLNLRVPSSPVAATSDANGRFSAALPVTDSYQFAIPIGSSGLQFGLVRTAGKQMETQIIVNPGMCIARYGYVIDAVTRQPIAGAQVSRFKSAITDKNGYYRIELACEPRDWGSGTTTISASHPAYQFHWDIDGRSENTASSGIIRHDFALEPLPQ